MNKFASVEVDLSVLSIHCAFVARSAPGVVGSSLTAGLSMEWWTRHWKTYRPGVESSNSVSPANEPCWMKGTPLAPTGQTMLDTVWVWVVYGSPISNWTLVGPPATAALSERVWRIPSRSVRPLSYQYAGWSLRWNDSGASIGGSGASSVGFQVAGLNFGVPPDGDDAPARPARLAVPTTVASRNRAGSPNSFLLNRERGRVIDVAVNEHSPFLRA